MAGALLALAMFPACVTRGYPTHGGGKRFAPEQAIVTRSIDGALSQVDFSGVKDLIAAPDLGPTSVAVQVFSVAHSGGGVQSSAGFLGSLLGITPVIGSGQQGGGGWQPPSAPAHGYQAVAAGAVANALPAGPGTYSAFAFESADDIRYLMGRVVERLGAAGLRVATPKGEHANPVICILVSELGIDQSDFSALVYSEKELVARTSVEAFLISNGEKDSVVTTPLGRGTSAWRFREDFFLGFGPLSGGVPEEVER